MYENVISGPGGHISALVPMGNVKAPWRRVGAYVGSLGNFTDRRAYCDVLVDQVDEVAYWMANAFDLGMLTLS